MNGKFDKNTDGREQAKPANGVQSPGGVVAGQATAIKALSPRQLEIARLIAAGLTDKEIANQLHLTEGTVGWHLEEIFHKWGVHSRVALAIRFTREQNGVV
ncbi:MAG TPA: LuxR C-terminal-related transcriptional regulator [Verrucomicrobiae bacterium]|jgi:DNA-binding NarL/FixJ family response regulator